MTLNEIKNILTKYNQEHLLDFFNELSNTEKDILLKQLSTTNFDEIQKLYTTSNFVKSITVDRITPMPVIRQNELSNSDIDYYSQIGNTAILNNKLAIITLAGGQGTRLGYKGPKGSYEIDVPPKKSLFEFACDNLLKLSARTGVFLNWYIMTSPSNDLATKNFFKSKNFFNYPADKIKFFKQNTLPIMDINQKIILDTPYSLKYVSNGNGDVFTSFASAGFINELKALGIEWIFIGGIDNILLKLVDPLFLGLTIANKYLIASKSIRKEDYSDKEWVFANVDNKPSIINPADFIGTNTNLDLYNQTNILAHLFSITAFEKLVSYDFPYHQALKKCDFINSEKVKEVPNKPNAYKFEKFIFDSFKLFDQLLLLEVDRYSEFAPIKSFTGKHTPETALSLYKNHFNLL